MMKIDADFSQITAMLNADEIEEEMYEAMEDMMTDIFVGVTDAPPSGSPVISGTLRNGFQLDLSDPKNPEIYNRVVYADKINRKSRQSVPRFVDKVVDKVVR
jgi:hypothetical protein